MAGRVLLLISLFSFHGAISVQFNPEDFVLKALEMCISTTAENQSPLVDMSSWRLNFMQKCAIIFRVCQRPISKGIIAKSLCGRIDYRRKISSKASIQQHIVNVAHPYMVNVTFLTFNVHSTTGKCQLDSFLLTEKPLIRIQENANSFCGKKDPWFIIMGNKFSTTALLENYSSIVSLVYSVMLKNITKLHMDSPQSPAFFFDLTKRYYTTFEVRGRIDSHLLITIDIKSVGEENTFSVYDGPLFSPANEIGSHKVQHEDKTFQYKTMSHIARIKLTTRDMITATGKGYFSQSAHFLYEEFQAELPLCTNSSLKTMLDATLNFQRCYLSIKVQDDKYFVMDSVEYIFNGPTSQNCDYAGYYFVLPHDHMPHGPYCSEKMYYDSKDIVFASNTSEGHIVIYNYHTMYDFRLKARIRMDECQGMMVTNCTLTNSIHLSSHSCYNVLLDATKCDRQFSLYGHQEFSIKATIVWPPVRETLKREWLIYADKVQPNPVLPYSYRFQIETNYITFPFSNLYYQHTVETTSNKLIYNAYRVFDCWDRFSILFQAKPIPCLHQVVLHSSKFEFFNSTCGAILFHKKYVGIWIVVNLNAVLPSRHHYVVEVKTRPGLCRELCMNSVVITDRSQKVDYDQYLTYWWQKDIGEFSWRSFSTSIDITVGTIPCLSNVCKVLTYRAVPSLQPKARSEKSGCVLEIPGFEEIAYFHKTMKNATWDNAQEYCKRNLPNGYSSGSLANLKTKELVAHLNAAAPSICASSLSGLFGISPVYIGLSSEVRL